MRATEIKKAMKLAAARALAELSREPVPDMVNKAYGDNTLSFGRTYLIPKPQDPRLIMTISPAVARAAMESSVARRPIEDWTVYEDQLRARLGVNQKLMNRITSAARMNPKRVVFAEADNYKILKAAQIVLDEGVCTLILPNVESGNIAYKVLQEIGDAEVIRPVLMGMRKPVHILQLGASVRDIVNMKAIAVVDAQTVRKPL